MITICENKSAEKEKPKITRVLGKKRTVIQLNGAQIEIISKCEQTNKTKGIKSINLKFNE